MNDEQPIQLGKWYGLLSFAAGSILTAIMSALDFGVGPMGGRSVGLGITLIAWTIIGGVIGVWILRGHSWRQGVERDTRLRLAVAYFAVTWGGLFGMTLHSPISAVTIVVGIAAVIFFFARGLESRQRRRDEGDTFP